MKRKVLFAISLLVMCISITNCEKPCTRTGAKCKDGTTSTATGSGACSGHGGVKDWICG